MPRRVRNVRKTILLPLLFFGAQAGLAAGPLRAGADRSAPRPETRFRATMVDDPRPVTTVTTDGATRTAAALAAPAPPPGPPSPAAAIVPADRLHLEPVLTRAAQEYGIPVDLFLAQAWVESAWKVDAVSHKGAVGVLQVMPDTVVFVSRNLMKLAQPLDVLDPEQNARMGARFMHHLLDQLDGNVRQALIAYNQGLTGLRRRGPVPAAVTYADRVLALRPRFAGG